uniref:Uncharacterized protein n=1 Tax=Setaria italica TaxID=4555 RepID=K4APG1_SETIT
MNYCFYVPNIPVVRFHLPLLIRAFCCRTHIMHLI